LILIAVNGIDLFIDGLGYFDNGEEVLGVGEEAYDGNPMTRPMDLNSFLPSSYSP
jgi:hypothetical protein